MIKKEIADNVYQYTFSKNNGGFESVITVCISNQKALLIDVAYNVHAEAVSRDLKAMAAAAEIVIWSHCHEDHIVGSALFPRAKIHAGKFYEQNYNSNLMEYPQLEQSEPHYIVDHINHTGESLNFGSFDIHFLYTPGHSKCSITTLINTGDNKNIMHVGDLIIYSDNKKPVLPYICQDSSVQEHIASLEYLKSIDVDVMLMGHGSPIRGKEAIHNAIDDRLYYLRKLLSSNGTLPLKKCLMHDITLYSHCDFHELNLKPFIKSL
jgi:glyoxylase-like metal-dependent hydrolase (beta-lactamase superfamily II)